MIKYRDILFMINNINHILISWKEIINIANLLTSSKCRDLEKQYKLHKINADSMALSRPVAKTNVAGYFAFISVINSRIIRA